MRNERHSYDDRTRVHDTPYSADLQDRGLRRQHQKRARDDQGHESNDSRHSRRRHDVRQQHGNQDRSPKGDGRHEYGSPQRRRRKYSSSPEHRTGKRDSRDDYTQHHRLRRQSRSRSPDSRRADHRSDPRRRSDSHRDPSPPFTSKRRHRDTRSRHSHSGNIKSRSNSPRRHKKRVIPTLLPTQRSHAPLPSQEDVFNGTSISRPPENDPPPEKQKPNYAPSGKLAAETNTVANTSVVLKYNEPPAARLPPASASWRLYIFKGDALLETLPLHTRSCWLFGRERLVVDCTTEHPSCSKQHAVIQFRYMEVKNEYGDKEGKVRPYVIDLESANGTKVNGELVPERRYVELMNKDVITFGESTREYVLVLPPNE